MVTLITNHSVDFDHHVVTVAYFQSWCWSLVELEISLEYIQLVTEYLSLYYYLS